MVADYIANELHRPLMGYFARRKPSPSPMVGICGPKVMIYFKQAKIGPLVGTRTWGAQNERIASDIDVEITDVTRSSNAPYRER